MTTLAEHELSFQLNASAIDEASGVIRGATVAQAGVDALGKYILLDSAGKMTRNEAEAVKKLKVTTDEATLQTLMEAVKAAGGVFKVRSDHDDSLESRAGYADNFALIGNRVVCDLHLNKSYRDRDIVLETAKTTPKLIGLSIDMIPSFAITNESALMRISELLAVDIVDAGAITHDGLFLSREVDSKNNIVITHPTSPETKMADQKEPTIADCMSAIASLAASVAKLSTPPAPEGKKDEQLAAEVSELKVQLAAVKAEQVKLSQERAALGLKSSDANLASAEAEAERVRLAAEAAKGSAKPKTYLEAVELAKTEKKMKASEAHRFVMSANPELYAAHLAGLNVAKK